MDQFQRKYTNSTQQRWGKIGGWIFGSILFGSLTLSGFQHYNVSMGTDPDLDLSPQDREIKRGLPSEASRLFVDYREVSGFAKAVAEKAKIGTPGAITKAEKQSAKAAKKHYLHMKKALEEEKGARFGGTRIIQALRSISEAGGFKKAGIDPEEFWANARRVGKACAETNFEDVVAEAQKDNGFNANEIYLIEEVAGTLGGYDNVGVDPKEMYRLAKPGSRDRIFKSIENGAQSLEALWGSFSLGVTNIKAVMNGITAYFWSGMDAHAFKRGYQGWFAEEAREEFESLPATPALGKNGKPLNRHFFLNAYVYGAGGLDNVGISSEDFKRKTGRPYRLDRKLEL